MYRGGEGDRQLRPLLTSEPAMEVQGMSLEKRLVKDLRKFVFLLSRGSRIAVQVITSQHGKGGQINLGSGHHAWTAIELVA